MSGLSFYTRMTWRLEASRHPQHFMHMSQNNCDLVLTHQASAAKRAANCACQPQQLKLKLCEVESRLPSHARFRQIEFLRGQHCRSSPQQTQHSHLQSCGSRADSQRLRCLCAYCYSLIVRHCCKQRARRPAEAHIRRYSTQLRHAGHRARLVYRSGKRSRPLR